jgi:methylated-DNA-[protein]-cysteine S-methyltransferase
MTLYKRGIKLLIGNITLVADDDALLEIKFSKSIYKDKSTVLDLAEAELIQYFEGKIKKFKTPIKLIGTEFQVKCWKVLNKIEYGKTISYKQEAMKLGGANYSRAVAGANNKNKLPVIVCCHRVIGSDGNLVGYAGGLKLKERLLLIESI